MLQLDHVLRRPVPTFDLALGLRVIRATPGVVQLPFLQILAEFARDVGRARGPTPIPWTLRGRRLRLFQMLPG
jgi:hypothetical protein